MAVRWHHTSAIVIMWPSCIKMQLGLTSNFGGLQSVYCGLYVCTVHCLYASLHVSLSLSAVIFRSVIAIQSIFTTLLCLFACSCSVANGEAHFNQELDELRSIFHGQFYGLLLLYLLSLL